eukprot:UN23182
MYNELSQYWNQVDSCKMLHSIHGDWSPRRLATKIHSRITTSCYHGFACGQGYLRSRRYRYGKCSSANCRHGCNMLETAEHILVHCIVRNVSFWLLYAVLSI